MIKMAADLGLAIEEGLYTVYDFVTADEVFLANTVSGIAPVVNIDGWTIGTGKPGPYSEKFQKIYLDWLLTGKYGTQVFPEAWSEDH